MCEHAYIPGMCAHGHTCLVLDYRTAVQSHVHIHIHTLRVYKYTYTVCVGMHMHTWNVCSGPYLSGSRVLYSRTKPSIYIYIYIYIHTHRHLYTYEHIHTHTDTHTYTVCVCVYIYIYIYMHTWNVCSRPYLSGSKVLYILTKPSTTRYMQSPTSSVCMYVCM